MHRIGRREWLQRALGAAAAVPLSTIPLGAERAEALPHPFKKPKSTVTINVDSDWVLEHLPPTELVNHFHSYWDCLPTDKYCGHVEVLEITPTLTGLTGLEVGDLILGVDMDSIPVAWLPVLPEIGYDIFVNWTTCTLHCVRDKKRFDSILLMS